jgi:LacI family transcriptional regulator
MMLLVCLACDCRSRTIPRANFHLQKRFRIRYFLHQNRFREKTMSIQALADSLGISISTVSRALNGYTDVSVTTRQRVFDAAKAMNYSPHPVAHRLATGKTGAIAIVNSTRSGRAIDGSSALLHTGVSLHLRTCNYFALSVSLPADEQEMPELERLLAARLVDGVVLTRTRTRDPRVALLQDKKIPFITYGRTTDNAPHAWVDNDGEGAFELVTRTLIELGHRRIALINGMAHICSAHLYEQGFRKALHDAGISADGCPVHYTELTGQVGHHIATQLLSQPNALTRPTAFVCATDAVALGVMAAVRDRGLRVGVDVSVSGYGNSEAGQFSATPLTSLEHEILRNGSRIAEMLLALICADSPASPQFLEPAKLLLRASVGPRPLSASP